MAFLRGLRPGRGHRAFVYASFAALAISCTATTPREAEPDVVFPVIAEPVRLGDIRGVVSATGLITTLPDAEFAVVAPQTARIVEVTKTAGDAVKTGEILVRFEFPSLAAETAARAAALRAAEVRLRNATLAQERVHSLLDRGAAARMEADDADRELEAAEAELADAQQSQKRTAALGQNSTLRAPFNGIVVQRLRNAGDLVGAAEGDVILRIVDPRQVQVIATVSVADIARFAVGASGRVMVEGNPTPEPVRVIARPEAVRGDSAVPVRLSFVSPTELATGTQVGIEIDAEQRSNVPLVPTIAVIRDSDNRAAVFVAVGNRATRRSVDTGLVDTEHTEIRSGVKPGELVITQGHSGLRDGTAVSVSDAGAP
jgi:RND family efflux transporter MFP subunit